MTDLDDLSLTLERLIIKDSDYVAATRIQAWYRGVRVRQTRLPPIMYLIRDALVETKLELCKSNNDGRVNSSIDEELIIKTLEKAFEERIKVPKIRMWYDLLVYDLGCGWIPINIKTTTTTTCDNVGNLAMCVYSYTDQKLDIHRPKTYENGPMAAILVKKLKSREYNFSKRDYYFLVVNKTNPRDVILGSLRGLRVLTPNINNLPFQVCWDKNRNYKRPAITKNIKTFLAVLRSPAPSWKETFLAEVRQLGH